MEIYDNIRKTLTDYYFGPLPDKVEEIREKVYSKMDDYYDNHKDASSYHLKSKLYEVITDTIEPVVFQDIPFFFETGALLSFCDGTYFRGTEHANGWLYCKKFTHFKDIDPHAYELNIIHQGTLYQHTGIYPDMMHLGIPMKKLFEVGLKGVLKELDDAEKTCETEQEQDFISCCRAGITALCRIAEKFASVAKKAGMDELAEIAAKVPFNPPETMHEGLCVMAFIRKALGSMEGMGFSSFGRADVLLYPLYQNDIARGVTHDELLDLVTRFLLIWDSAFDRKMVIQPGSRHEMENTLTLGGIDKDGNHIFNEVTKLFLEAREKETIIFPKMMLRYSQSSPKEYLELITAPLLKGQSLSIYENDDSVIPALIASGVDKEDAYDYVVGGCWDILLPNVAIHNSGEYVNIIKPLEWSVHDNKEAMESNEIFFESLEDIKTFEEIYYRYLGFIRRLMMRHASIIALGARQWHKVNPVCAFSALTEVCIPNKLDITAGGGKYNRETAYLCGFAEAVDSLLAIKHLCYDNQVCTVKELFDQCKNNWQDEVLRQKAINAPSHGDGSDEASEFVARFIDDLHRITRDLPTAQEGKYRLGSYLYLETIEWGKKTPAMPNGRHNGDPLAQGITPARIQKPISISEMLYSYSKIDMTKFAMGASATITLPAAKLNKEHMVALLRTIAQSGVQALQPNCINIDDLRAAQKDPENYKHLIVRVCGFSAPFVSLSEGYQEEFISRMMLEL